MSEQAYTENRGSAFDELGFGPTIHLIVDEIQALYCLDEIPWVVGYSGGKDSTAILQLIWKAISELPEDKRLKPVHVISTDTLVESPVVSGWVRHSLERMELAAGEQELPIYPRMLFPETDDSFWVNLIGRGYPAPRHLFRWCTERLKISPSGRFIQNVVQQKGEAIVVLGTRKAESAKRHATLKKHEEKRLRERLSPNASLPNSLVYTPIEDWTNDDVWVFLMQMKNFWGHSNKDLLTMYRGASADGECPLVVDTTTQSCGNSRFGCWVCTLVDQDRSMAAMVQNDEEKEWMMPLLQFRNELDPRVEVPDEKSATGTRRYADDRDKRSWRRRNGRVQVYTRNIDGEKVEDVIPGPYTKGWREHWLRRLLETQVEAQTAQKKLIEDLAAEGRTTSVPLHEIELITSSELETIRQIWRDEEQWFDDALPGIFESVLNVPFEGKSSSDGVALGGNEWDIIGELCGEDELHFELVTRLLDTERKFNSMGRRRGIYDALEKCFAIAGFESKEEAIVEAKRKRGLAKGGDALKGSTAEVALEIVEEILSAEVGA